MAILKSLLNLLRRWFLHLFQGNSLKDKRKRYVYGPVSTDPTKNTLPGMNVQNNGTGDIPFEQEPTLGWLFKVAEVALKVAENHKRDLAERGADASKQDAHKQKVDNLQDVVKQRGNVSAADVKAQIGSVLTQIAEQKSDAHSTMHWPANLSEYNSHFRAIPIPALAPEGHPTAPGLSPRTPQVIDQFFTQGSTGEFDDQFFANLRTAGYNPMVIEGLDAVPSEFAAAGFDDARYRQACGSAFSNDTLAAAAGSERLYVCDYAPLAGLVAEQPDKGGNFPNDTQKYLYTAKAWFVLPPSASDAQPEALRPLAIQLEPDGYLFYPNDNADPNGQGWTQAKYAVNSADANYHELASHLGWTHLVIEPFVISTERQLAQGHEIYKLLSPHFEGTIFINNAAVGGLIAAGGQVDQVVASTIELDQEFAVKARGVNASGLFNFNDHMVPEDLKNRKVSAKKLIFPYRDDATKIWAAISLWVSDYVDVYYRNDAHVTGDVQLQQWARELVSPDGGQLQGFGDSSGGNSNVINTKAYLKKALTMVIFTGSAQHAAVNFAQSQIMVYAPAVAGALYAQPPTRDTTPNVGVYSTNGTDPGLLTPDSIAKVQLDFLSLLGGVYYTQLGDYRHEHFPRSITKANGPLDNFRRNLAAIGDEINNANNDADRRPLIYPYLHPKLIPQSINI